MELLAALKAVHSLFSNWTFRASVYYVILYQFLRIASFKDNRYMAHVKGSQTDGYRYLEAPFPDHRYLTRLCKVYYGNICTVQRATPNGYKCLKQTSCYLCFGELIFLLFRIPFKVRFSLSLSLDGVRVPVQPCRLLLVFVI